MGLSPKYISSMYQELHIQTEEDNRKTQWFAPFSIRI